MGLAAAPKRWAFRLVAALLGEREDALEKTIWRSRALVDELPHLFPTPAQRRLARAVATVLPLTARLPILGRRGLPLSVELRGVRRHVRVGQPEDLDVLAEVLGRNAYEVPGVEDARTVIDLGSHIGLSLLYFRARFPTARIVGVEPDPRNWRLLRRNVAGLPGVDVRHAAAAATDGWCELRLDPKRHSSSTVGGAPREQPLRIPAESLDTLADGLGHDRIDLLKIDIEGAEWEVLKDAKSLNRVDAIVGEFHPPLLGEGVGEEDMLALLDEFDLELDRYPDYGAVLVSGRRA